MKKAMFQTIAAFGILVLGAGLAMAQNSASVVSLAGDGIEPLSGTYSYMLDLNNGAGGDTSQVYVLDDSPDGETTYRVKFLFKRNGMTFDNLRDRGSIMVVRQQLPDSSWLTVGRILIIRTVSFGYVGRAAVRRNAEYAATQPWQHCADWGWPDATGPLSVREVIWEWQAASADGANDGYCKITVNGDPKGEVTNIDNDERWVDNVWMGMVEGNIGRAHGYPMFDDFESYRTLQ